MTFWDFANNHPIISFLGVVIIFDIVFSAMSRIWGKND
jgi:hypothetical protein